MTPPPPPLEARDYIGLGASVGSSSSPTTTAAGGEAHLALRLGLPGSESPGRRVEAEDVDAVLTLGCPAPAPLPRAGGAKRGLDRSASRGADAEDVVGLRGEDRGDGDAAAGAPRAAKAQVVGWPPVRSYRKNTLAATANATKTKVEDEGRNETGCCYVKVKAVHPNHQEEIGLVMVLVPMPFRTKSMSLLMKTRMLTGCSLVICLGTCLPLFVGN